MKITTEELTVKNTIATLSIKEAVTILRLYADHLENIRRSEYIGNATYDDYIENDSIYGISQKWIDSELFTLSTMMTNSLSLINKYSTLKDFKTDIDRWCKNSNDENWGSDECECIDYETATQILSKIDIGLGNIIFRVDSINGLEDFETIKKIEKLGKDLRRESIIKDFKLPKKESFNVFITRN